MRENDFLAWIGRQTPGHGRVAVNVGDDMAGVRMGGGEMALLKIDQCLDGVHFDLRRHTMGEAGRKAVNRCLSDCAAMACVPGAILLAVALPKEGPGSGEAGAKEMFLACQEAGAAFDCPVVGGDTAVWDQRLAITVAALGMTGPGGRVILRSGARVGDVLLVSGRLGGAMRGRHMTFVPRIELALKVARAAGGGLHAMMDLSDGLAQDLPRMCAASGVGAEVHAARLPVHEDAWALAAEDGVPAGLHALADGEDYELLLAMAPAAVPEVVGITEAGLTAIGTVVAGGLKLVDAGGGVHGWPRGGWEHGAGGE